MLPLQDRIVQTRGSSAIATRNSALASTEIDNSQKNRKKSGNFDKVLTIWNLERGDRDRVRPSLEKIIFWWNGAGIGEDCAVEKSPRRGL